MNALHEQLARALCPFAVAILLGGLLRAGEHDGQVVDDGACRAFSGAVSGNDPDVRVRLTLCRDGDDLAGQLVWRGRSGLSVRDVEGVVGTEGAVHLVDARMVLDAPSAGWMFCPVDNYALVWDPEGGSLSGTYASRSCDDTAGVWLAPSR